MTEKTSFKLIPLALSVSHEVTLKRHLKKKKKSTIRGAASVWCRMSIRDIQRRVHWKSRVPSCMTLVMHPASVAVSATHTDEFQGSSPHDANLSSLTIRPRDRN